MSSNEFGRWLAREIKARQHTDRSFSELFHSDGGLTHASIGRWRRGEAVPSPEHVAELAQVLGVERRLIYGLLGQFNPYPEKQLSPEQRYVVEAITSRLTNQQVRMLQAMVDSLIQTQEPQPRPSAGHLAPAAKTCG